ncbi:hypothetical protein [Sinorhizobium meliloti]|nr:hypothetical protein [Sinorhizobium meliloti]
MRDQRLICAVAGKRVGDDLRDQIRVGRAREVSYQYDFDAKPDNDNKPK